MSTQFPGVQRGQFPGRTSGYNASVLTVTNQSTPDPYVLFHSGKFYMTWTCGDRVEIWSCADLLIMGANCNKTVIWKPPPNIEYSGGIWAPELHDLRGRWHVYVACEDPRVGNASHRMYVLGGPPSNTDPCNSSAWEFLGPIQGLPPQQWAIDGTMLILHNELFFVYSGWPLHNPGNSDKIQELFIVHMSSPTQASSQPVCLCQPTESWECSDQSRINEGPQFLYSPDGSWIGLAYSCAGSWTKDYKMNTLRYIGGDPLNPTSWQKSRKPLITTSPSGRPPFGPGHGSFVHINNETWAVYHATDRDNEGWENRKARVQRVHWGYDGPHMGGCCGDLVHDPRAFLTPNMPPASIQTGMAPPQRPGLSGDRYGSGGGFDRFIGKIKDKMRNL